MVGTRRVHVNWSTPPCARALRARCSDGRRTARRDARCSRTPSRAARTTRGPASELCFAALFGWVGDVDEGRRAYEDRGGGCDVTLQVE